MNGITTQGKQFATAHFSPISTADSLSPTDSKTAGLVNDRRYDSPTRNFTNEPPKDLNKPSPAGSVDSVTSIRSNFSINSNDSLYDRFTATLAIDRSSKASELSVPKYGEKRTSQETRFSADFAEEVDPSQRRKFIVKKNPTYGSTSCGSQERPLSSILKESDGRGKDDLYDRMDGRETKLLRR